MMKTCFDIAASKNFLKRQMLFYKQISTVIADDGRKPCCLLPIVVDMIVQIKLIYAS